ncbi:MAG: hypothetical protein WC209_14380 [Ignavibacteriaceae bacterium]|jgi:hypothetical protein
MKQISVKYFMTIAFAIFIWSGSLEAKKENSGGNNSTEKWSYNASDWCNKNVPTTYYLTSKQISSILYLRSKYNEIILPEIAKLDQLQKAIDNKSTGSVNNSSNEIQKLEEKLFELKLEARIQIRSHLSPKQITYFDDFVFSHWWEWKQQ